MDVDTNVNLLSEEAVRNPATCFGRLRDAGPLHWNTHHRAWILTRHADLTAAARNPHLSAERIMPFAEAIRRSTDSAAVDETLGVLSDWMVFRDPPDHTRLRRLVSRAFAPAVVRDRTSGIATTINRLLDDLPHDEPVDLIRGFAHPLPAIVIAEMLGAPPGDRDLFKVWSDQITALVFGATDREDRYERAATGMLELRDYLLARIAHFERHPADNLITMLLQREGDESLSREELVATCILLLFGGHETTTNLIGNGVLALLDNQDQLDALRRDESLIESAVEEILRFDAPTRATVRMVKQDHELHGRNLLAGQRVFLLNPAANHDPDVFEQPDRFDVTRNPTNHVGFGYGPHYCLGAPLARLEGRMAIGALVQRFPDMRAATNRGQLEWHATMLSRGLVALPVVFE